MSLEADSFSDPLDKSPAKPTSWFQPCESKIRETSQTEQDFWHTELWRISRYCFKLLCGNLYHSNKKLIHSLNIHPSFFIFVRELPNFSWAQNCNSGCGNALSRSPFMIKPLFQMSAVVTIDGFLLGQSHVLSPKEVHVQSLVFPGLPQF